ncbi:MAG: hypothetical protein MRZ65_02450 [Lachnospiraceae bacterium]|nr:hypothetical protein [Lachnospiraceae bacterium]
MAEEEEQKKRDKKAEKAAAKEAKKKAKQDKKSEIEDDEEETSAGGKVAVFLATVIIIAIWLGILVLVIKWDVGGFGSTVLYPIFKDTPYLNKILPDVEVPIEQQEYPYTTLSEATDYVKELEQKLAKAEEKIEKKDEKIKELKSQVEKLSVYEENEAAFEKLKQKFDREVVFSDNAPDISNYQEYYESIDPQNAEIIYRQVLEQQKKSAELEDYVKTYSSMKPKKAAAMFDTMTDNFSLVADILLELDAQTRADILAAMKAENAARLTAMMNPDE